jgi:hypothetical protein
VENNKDMQKSRLLLYTIVSVLFIFGKSWADNQPENFNVYLTAGEAEQLVRQIPEVRSLEKLIREKGAIPFTMLDPGSEAESKQERFFIYFGEDHGTHTVRVATFVVEGRTGKVSVYEVVNDTIIPLEKWQTAQKPVVTMERTMCYGTCPVYKLIIYGNGTG